MGWSTLTVPNCLFISLNPLSTAEAAKPPNRCYKYPTALQRIIRWSRIFLTNRFTKPILTIRSKLCELVLIIPYEPVGFVYASFY